jgi:hypothetical protein
LSISMEEALGLNQLEEEFSEADLKRFLRRKLVFERRARGDTVEEIVSFCQKNGYPVTERTIFRDLRSEEVCSLIDELVRVQFRDITLLRGFALQKDPKDPEDKNWKPNLKAFSAAIGARGFMISCLKPKVEPKVNVEVNVANKTEHVLLAEYAGVISEAATLNSNLSAVCVGEQVDSKASSSGDEKKRSEQ